MLPQCAAWPPPYQLGRAVGESNLSPNWLATCCQPGQRDWCSQLGLMKGAPRSPKCGRGLSQGWNPNQDAGQVQPPRLLSPLGQSPRCHMSMHRGMGGGFPARPSPQTQPIREGLGTPHPPLCSRLGGCVAAAGPAGEVPAALAPWRTQQVRAAQVGAVAWAPPLRGPSLGGEF